jgi:forespore regulator of the sigma-K checkpoint
MKRHWLFFLACAVLLPAVLAGGTYFVADTMKRQADNAGDPAIEAMAQPHELVLARTYLCGLKDEERKPLKGESLEQVLSAYTGWEIISAEAGKLILQKRENDISPTCKANGYFGLSPDGVLTLFNGLPAEQDVIQTFYQINTKRMEAGLPKEDIELLQKGIRVRDLAEYNSVLSTYGEFQAAEPEEH